MKLIAWSDIKVVEEDVKYWLKRLFLKTNDTSSINMVDSIDFYAFNGKDSFEWEDLKEQSGIDLREHMSEVGAAYLFTTGAMPFISEIESIDYYSLDYRQQAVKHIMKEYYDLTHFKSDYGAIEDYCMSHEIPVGAYILCGDSGKDVCVVEVEGITRFGTLYEGDDIPMEIEINYSSGDSLYLQERA